MKRQVHNYSWCRKLAFVAFIFLYHLAIGQVSYHNFNANSGLPSNEVYCVIQDKQGYLWFGTDHGAARYDGHSFQIFTTRDGLTDNTVLSVKEDNDGLIWFLTYTGGICYYDGKSVYPHPMNDAIRPLFLKRVPTSWIPTKNKEIWIGVVGSGFYKIGLTRVQPFSANENPKFSNKNPYNFYIINFTDHKYIYTTTLDKSLNDISDKAISNVEHFDMPGLDWELATMNFQLVKLNDGGILFGEADLVFHKPVDNIAKRINWHDRKGLVKLLQLRDSTLWVNYMYNAGLSVKLEKGALKILDSLISVTAISDMYLDAQGNYWLTSLEKGIFLLPNISVRTFRSSVAAPDERVLSLAADNGDNLYVAYPHTKLMNIHSSMRSVQVHHSLTNSAYYTSLETGRDGRLITNNDTDFLDVQHKMGGFFFTKILEMNGREYLIGRVNGFGIFKNNKIVFDSKNLDFNKRITALCSLGGNRYAVGTLEGLYYFYDDDSLRMFEEKGMSNMRITSCRRLNDTAFAVSTRGKGVFLFSGKRVNAISDSSGLSSNMIEDIYFADDSTLWTASYEGISKVRFGFHGNTLLTRINTYDKEDGLCSNQINAITGFNGYIWLGTNEGLCYFNPTSLPEDTLSVPFHFQNIYVNGVLHSGGSLNLSYEQNNFLFEFTALYFKATSGIRYKVRLKANDPWKYTNQNYVQYYNLPPGDYDLQVAAEGKFGKYRSKIGSIHFSIHPKFTDTTAFRAFLAVVILAIIAFIAFLIIRYQRLKSLNFIKLLKSEFKALNYQINPHFIFNVLNSIQYYILRKDSDKAVHFLNSFSTLIRRIVTNSRQQYVSVIEEVECLKEYMDLEKLRLENKFDYEINIESPVDIEAKILLPMIIQPIVENSIWHGIVPGQGNGRVKVDFKKDGNTLVVVVEDNGVGLHFSKISEGKSPQHLSMAMSNVRERLKIIADLNNSSWYIHIADKIDLGFAEGGAIVTIRFPEIKRD